MKSKLQIALLAAALIAIGLLSDAWRTARRDAAQLNSTLSSQNEAMRQIETQQKQRDAQLAAQLATIAAQKRAVKTPQQAAQAIPTVLPPLPLPVAVQIPDLTPHDYPDRPPPASISVPQADLKPLYDALQDCRACALENDALKKDLAAQQARTASVTQERDAAIAAAHGGTFWLRLKRSAKWFAIGAVAGAAATAAARH